MQARVQAPAKEPIFSQHEWGLESNQQLASLNGESHADLVPHACCLCLSRESALKLGGRGDDPYQ